MDTLSSTVSALKVPSLNSTTREFHLFNYTSRLLPQHIPSKSNSISNKTNSNFTHKTTTPPPLSAAQTTHLHHSPPPQPPSLHREASTGYAAALVDIAQQTTSLHLVQNDVQKLLTLINKNKQLRTILNNPLMGERVKGQVVGEIAAKLGLHKHLVRLAKMLVKRNKVGILEHVLDEFERIYDELCGTQLVLVPSAMKMDENQLLGIAEEVQKFTGALKVKVKNFVGDNLPCLSAA